MILRPCFAISRLRQFSNFKKTCAIYRSGTFANMLWYRITYRTLLRKQCASSKNHSPTKFHTRSSCGLFLRHAHNTCSYWSCIWVQVFHPPSTRRRIWSQRSCNWNALLPRNIFPLARLWHSILYCLESFSPELVEDASLALLCNSPTTDIFYLKWQLWLHTQSFGYKE